YFISSRRRHTRAKRDWISDACSSDLVMCLLVMHLWFFRFTCIFLRFSVWRHKCMTNKHMTCLFIRLMGYILSDFFHGLIMCFYRFILKLMRYYTRITIRYKMKMYFTVLVI